MTDSDMSSFIETMRGLQEIFVPDKPISTAKIELYFRFFAKHTIEEFRQACNNMLGKKKISTFPLPAEIEECLAGDDALKAWLMAMDAAGRHGAQYSVTFQVTVIHSIIKNMGGWSQFCEITQQERPWKQKEFERLYGVLKDKELHPEQCVGLYWPENQVEYKEVLRLESNDAQKLVN